MNTVFLVLSLPMLLFLIVRQRQLYQAYKWHVPYAEDQISSVKVYPSVHWYHLAFNILGFFAWAFLTGMAIYELFFSA